MRIAVAQISATTDPLANLDLVEDNVVRAAAEGADLVVFPEATMCSFARPAAEIAEPFDGPWAESVRGIAARHGVSVAVGMFTTADSGRVRNTLLVAGPTEARYDKIHLYDALGYRESRTIAPGEELATVEIAGVTVGLAICYDIRFPAQFQSLAREGASVILVSAAWAPGPHKIHQWRSLATARGMDSTAFVVAVDQSASGDPEVRALPTGVGHSIVVDPTGKVLLELGTADELAVIDIDPAEAEAARESLPILIP